MTSIDSDENEIMLIDDDKDDCYLIQSSPSVHELRLKLTTHSNGNEALIDLAKRLRLSKPKPKFILLDLNMPIMNGFDFLQKIKSDEKLKIIPVIVYTSSKSESDINTSYQLGANCYTVKPLDYKETLITFKLSCEYWLRTAHTT